MSRRPLFPGVMPVISTPRPIAPARWLPLAKKHGLNVDFQNCAVTVLNDKAPQGIISEFWGDGFADQDVGACVLRVVKMIGDANAALPCGAPP